MLQNLGYHDIVSLEDPRYDDYLDLYQQCFPPNEQELVSRHNRILRVRMRGEETPHHMFVAVAPAGETVGMARYEVGPDAGVLWYLAVKESCRGGGLGSAMYAEVTRRLRAEIPDAPALVYEVEMPSVAADAEEAERRIRFYQRNGGYLLDGIAYTQSVGWQPPVPMHLMVHPFRPMGAGEALAVCQAVFGESVRALDAPTLRGLG